MPHLLRPLLLCLATALAGGAAAAPQQQEARGQRHERVAEQSTTQGAGRPVANPRLPKRQVGKASIYADKFAGRKMANGRRMDPRDDNAASKTLPLGSKALVRNLDTGKSAVVTIEDRGPFIAGRVVDLSPATAEQIGLSRKEGLAPVEVIPLQVPDKDATIAER